MKLKNLISKFEKGTYVQVFKMYDDDGDELIYYGNSADFLEYIKTKEILDAEVDSVQTVPYIFEPNEIKSIYAVKSQLTDDETGILKASDNTIVLANVNINETEFRDDYIEGFKKKHLI